MLLDYWVRKTIDKEMRAITFVQDAHEKTSQDEVNSHSPVWPFAAPECCS